MKNLNCLFLRNFTMEPIEDSIINWSKSFDINLKPFFSDYDNIIQSSLNKNFIKKKILISLLFFYGYRTFRIFWPTSSLAQTKKKLMKK